MDNEYFKIIDLDEIEKELSVKFSLEETLEIKTVGNFKKKLEKHGVNLDE